MLWQFFSLPGIENGIEFWYFSRYRIEVRNSSIVTTLAHSAKATSTWFKDHGIPVLNWPANSPDLNPIENLWGIVKRKMRYARPNNAEELKATIRAIWALITPEQCHRLIDSMPRRPAAVIQAKGAPTKYWVLYMLILFMFILFSWPRFLKILSLYWS